MLIRSGRQYFSANAYLRVNAFPSCVAPALAAWSRTYGHGKHRLAALNWYPSPIDRASSARTPLFNWERIWVSEPLPTTVRAREGQAERIDVVVVVVGDVIAGEHGEHGEHGDWPFCLGKLCVEYWHAKENDDAYLPPSFALQLADETVVMMNRGLLC